MELLSKRVGVDALANEDFRYLTKSYLPGKLKF
jgi:hypothetical protein